MGRALQVCHESRLQRLWSEDVVKPHVAAVLIHGSWRQIVLAEDPLGASIICRNKAGCVLPLGTPGIVEYPESMLHCANSELLLTKFG